MILPVKKNKNGFTVARVHYSLDPEKNMDAWILNARTSTTERGWMREYEIDYSTYEGKSFYPEFSEYNIAKQELHWEKGIIYRGWDYGFHHPACHISCINEFDQWCWLKGILGQDEGIKDFGMRIKRYCDSEYPGAKYIDADDIAGTQVSDKSEHTSQQILNSIGIYPQSRKQEIREGAEIIRQKLKMRIDGKPGLLVNPTEEIFIDGFKGGLHYPENKEGRPQSEHYEKDGYYDHCFIAGTKIGVKGGTKWIEDIVVGDMVWTRGGLRKVSHSGMTKSRARVETAKFSNGSTLTGTLNHPIWTKNRGWVRLDSLRYGDIIETWEKSNYSSLMESSIEDTQTLERQSLGITSQVLGAVKDFMLRFGKKITDPFLKDVIFIIKTAIILIMILVIWSVSLLEIILRYMLRFCTKTRREWLDYASTLSGLDHLPKHGMGPRRGLSGTNSMVKTFSAIGHTLREFVITVGRTIKPKIRLVQDFAPMVASLVKELKKEKTWWTGIVRSVGLYFRSINILAQSLVGAELVYYLGSTKHDAKDVYNLSIEEIPEYYANGVLVHNCFDSARYICIQMFSVTGIEDQENVIAKDENQERYRMGRPEGNDLGATSDIEEFF